jgi:hypothetical protein
MHDEKQDKRAQGDHLERNEVKKGIIVYILGHNYPVPEPELREHLDKKYSIRDVTNIKKHLKDLQKKPYSCIKKIVPKPGYSNKWDIDSIEQLRKIRKEFPEIDLTFYEKALNITLAQFMNLNDTLIEDNFRFFLGMSKTFFDMCIFTDKETLYERWLNLYLLTDEGNAYYEKVKKDEITKEELLQEYPVVVLPVVAFKHCIYQDILLGLASPKAIKFIEDVSKNPINVSDSAKEKIIEMVLKNYDEI